MSDSMNSKVKSHFLFTLWFIIAYSVSNSNPLVNYLGNAEKFRRNENKRRESVIEKENFLLAKFEV